MIVKRNKTTINKNKVNLIFSHDTFSLGKPLMKS